MTELSIFIDESGDVGSNSDFYIVTFVFHSQDNDILEQIGQLEQQLIYCDFPLNSAIHTGPIIRREEMYAHMTVSERKRIFTRLFSFTRSCGARYVSFNYTKKQFADRFELKTQFARDLSYFIRDKMAYFSTFEKVIVYYDNGQAVVTETIGTAFAAMFFDVEFRKVFPSEYRLFQSADLICTLEMLNMKVNANGLSKSELRFFGSERKLKKDYLKQMRKLRILD